MAESGVPAEQQSLTIEQAIDLGLQHHNAGRLPEAENIYSQILKINPDNAVVLNLLGVIAAQVNKFESAVEIIGKALAQHPEFAEAHNNLGLAQRGLKQSAEAAASFRKALALKPDYADAQNNLGVTLRELGAIDKAVVCFQNAIDLKADYLDAQYNLANLYHSLGKLDQAIDGYRKTLALKPDYKEVHLNLGIALKDNGALEQAIDSYRAALAIDVNFVEAHCNLGNALSDLNRIDEAIASYLNALKIGPNIAETHYDYGNALRTSGKLNKAAARYQKALALKPDFAKAHRNLSHTFEAQGDMAGAVKHLDMALSIEPENVGWRICKALLLPVIPHSQEGILSSRENLNQQIQSLLKQDIVIDDPTVDVGTSNFYLAYQNQNNKTLLGDIAKLFLKACPRLAFEAEHCRTGQNQQPKGRLKIGFLSSFFREHTVAKLTRGIIEHFSRTTFEVVVFVLGSRRDEMTKIIENTADRVVRLERKLEKDWQTIAGEELDILFYADIGMDHYSYFLSFARLAPVQAVTIGHAESSGVPNIDYFLSSELTEPADGAGHYSENLIKLGCLPTYYYRPELPQAKYMRKDYGLADGVRLYLYPQTLFKLHPGFDGTIDKLLRRDPNGRLVLIDDGKGGHLNRLVIERLSRLNPGLVEQIIFVPKMPYHKFLGLLVLADAVLDNPFLSGTNSGLEAFGVGAPIVAWPGPYCSGNCVTACYRQMGLSDLIASDEESFLQLTLRLASDKPFKAQMSADIEANAGKLFERLDLVREMERFFILAYAAAQENRRLTDAEFKKLRTESRPD